METRILTHQINELTKSIGKDELIIRVVKNLDAVTAALKTATAESRIKKILNATDDEVMQVMRFSLGALRKVNADLVRKRIAENKALRTEYATRRKEPRKSALKRLNDSLKGVDVYFTT